MNVLSTSLGLPHDEFWSISQLQMPEPLARALQWKFFEPQNIYHTDPRLQGYRVLLLISELTPTDPTDWVTCTLDSSGQQWRLWRIWVRYMDAPLLGELQYQAQQGWLEIISHPTWLERRATPQEFFKLAQGLAYAQQAIPRPGPHAEFGTREDFIRALLQAQRIVRRYRRLSKPAAARQMGISRSSLYQWLRTYPGSWEEAMQTVQN